MTTVYTPFAVVGVSLSNVN